MDRKQIGSLTIEFFYKEGDGYSFRIIFPKDNVPLDTQMDALTRLAAEFFRSYAEGVNKTFKNAGDFMKPYLDYYRGPVVDRFAALVKAYAGFSDKSPEELVASWDEKDTGGNDGSQQ